MFSRKTRLLLLCNIIIPILVGATIYFLLSPEVFFVKGINSTLRISSQSIYPGSGTVLFRLVRNYFPDIAWGYALMFSLYFCTGHQSERDLYRLAHIAIVFSAAIELLQLIPDLHGTFDVWDLVVELCTEVAVVFIIKKYFLREVQHEEKK